MEELESNSENQISQANTTELQDFFPEQYEKLMLLETDQQIVTKQILKIQL